MVAASRSKSSLLPLLVVVALASNVEYSHQFAFHGAMRQPSLELFKEGKMSYLADVSIGTGSSERQTFTLLLDTGSAALWVPSAKCETDACLARRRFDSSKSSSYQPSDNYRQYGFMDGQVIEGYEVQDSIVFGSGISATVINNQTFLEAYNIEDGSAIMAHIDGLLGLSFKHMTGSNYPIVLETMKKQGLIDQMMFSIYLHHNEELNNPAKQSSGKLLFGSQVDESKFQGDLKWVTLSRAGFWEVTVDRIRLVGGRGYNFWDTLTESSDPGLERARVCRNGCKAILDTGAYIIAGPADQVAEINGALGAQEMHNGVYAMVKCHEMAKRMPNLVFTIGGHEFTLKPQEYLIPIQSDNESFGCVSGIRATPDESVPYWVLGNIFVGSHYVAFDMENQLVGMAKVAHERSGLDQYLTAEQVKASLEN